MIEKYSIACNLDAFEIIEKKAQTWTRTFNILYGE